MSDLPMPAVSMIVLWDSMTINEFPLRNAAVVYSRLIHQNGVVLQEIIHLIGKCCGGKGVYVVEVEVLHSF